MSAEKCKKDYPFAKKSGCGGGKELGKKSGSDGSHKISWMR